MAKTHPFDALNAWAHIPETELLTVFDDDARSVIVQSATMLWDVPIDAQTITPKTFPRLARELRESLRLGSRALGDAIIRSRERQDVGDVSGAKAVFEAFLSECTWPFYRELAQSELRVLCEKR
jgi:hypothetical protein